MYVPYDIIRPIFSVSALIGFLLYILLKLIFISLNHNQPFKKRVVRTKIYMHVFISTNCDNYPAGFLIPDIGCQEETAHGFQ